MVHRIVVEDQSLRWYGRPPKIADDSIEFVRFQFHLPEDWDPLVLVAQFTQEGTYNMLLDEDICFLPKELTHGLCKLSLFGYTEGKPLRATSIPLVFQIEESGFVSSAETPIPPTPDLYAQLIKYFSSIAGSGGGGSGSGTINPEDIAAAVEDYLSKNPPDKGDQGPAGYSPIIGKDFWTAEDQKKIVSDVLSSEVVSQMQQDIQKIREDMDYKPIEITGISNNVGTVEKGTAVSEMTVTWSLNKDPVSQSLGGETLDVKLRQKTVSMTGRTSVRLDVTDERGEVDSASTGYNAYNGVYYGVLEDGATIDSAAILSLSKKLQSGRGITFTVNPGFTQRIAFAIPTGYGAPTFKDANTGFQADMYQAKKAFTFKNAHSYETTYDVWLSTNIVPGSITIMVT